MGASLSLDYITHRFSPTSSPTLQEIENRIEPGEMIALIGRSGCGKSTLLHMLAGLLIPSEGCVRINGHQVSKPSAKWNMMFQKASLYPWMSVKENASLGLMFAGVSSAEASARVDKLLDMVGLHDKKDVNVQSLSGGQQQRVALARSLATEPELLLLDEPFSALDAFTRNALQEEVPAICRERGITMVIVTHDIDEAITMADRVLIMSQNPGRIVSELKVELPWPRRHMDAGFQAKRDELMKRFKGTDSGLAGRQSEAETSGTQSDNAA
ncbi:ABC transporter ATP-binding protein [Ferrimonas sp.]|uniref:ABC transporter ATP-binding protein n=1 Tax=Ferrimonas sp. TaxID=2080861 RepID=UPI003A946D03